MKEKMSCEICTWWVFRDSARIMAKISETKGPFSRGIIELRKCFFNPAPGVDINFGEVYTDGDYVCSNWKEVLK